MNIEKLRTFIALEPNEAARKSMAFFSTYLANRRISLSNLKITDVNNIHLTLFFFGDFFGKDTIDKFLEEFKKIKFSRISFRFNKIGFFPDELRPRVIWIDPDEDASNKIIDIRNAIKEILGLYDFKDEERDFKPHITLARIKEFGIYKKYVDFIKSFSLDGIYSFDSLVLFNSTLTPNGPVYTKLAEVKGE